MTRARCYLVLAANAFHTHVEYAKKRHNQYALFSYVCLGMFQGFDSWGFGVNLNEDDDDGEAFNNLDSDRNTGS